MTTAAHKRRVSRRASVQNRDPEGRVNAALTAVYERHGMSYEVIGADHNTPAAELMRRESVHESPEIDGAERTELRAQGMHAALDIIFAQGPHPSDVIKNVYCLAKKIREELILGMSFDDLSNLLGGSHAQYAWRIKQLFTEPMKKHGAKAAKSSWQKGEIARARCKQAQLGNHNRRIQNPESRIQNEK